MPKFKQWNNVPGHWHTKQKPRARLMRREPTPEEAALWRALRGGKLGGYHFRRQHPISTFVLDFFCAAAQLGIEVDGGIHDEEKLAAYDEMREEIVKVTGVRLIRFSNEDVMKRLPEVLEKIRKVLQQEK